MAGEQDYEEWLEDRRSVRPSSDLADRIMGVVITRETTRRISLLIRVGLWIERSRLTRYAACAVALLVGSTPFLFLAHVAQLIVF
jgi:hypothetical protein